MAFKLAEAYVQFSQRGLSGVQSEISSVASRFRGATDIVSGFVTKMGLVGAGAGGAALLKFGADAEVAEVKLRTMLKSGDAAKQMMEDINSFAASTPFEQAEISGAVQKLLAFNIPAEEALQHLRAIGDISALTGNSLNDMADLYGKANVQGRLFGEDINQLTGRGIPIIQQLVSQFGVAESEVKSLVESGRVTKDNLILAFHAMTSAGGQFEGGMAQLAETTSGKLSTVTGNLKAEAGEWGQILLPAASEILDGTNQLIADFRDEFGSEIAGLTDSVGFVARNLKDVWGIAIEDTAILMHNGYQHVATFGTNVVEIGSWMTENWQSLLTDMGNLTSTVLTNIGDNLSEFLEQVKSWLAGDGFNFEFKALTAGFDPTTELPELTQAATIESTPERDRLLQKIANDEADRHQQELDRAKEEEKRRLESLKAREDAEKRVAKSAEKNADTQKKAAVAIGETQREQVEKSNRSISSAEDLFNQALTASFDGNSFAFDAAEMFQTKLANPADQEPELPAAERLANFKQEQSDELETFQTELEATETDRSRIDASIAAVKQRQASEFAEFEASLTGQPKPVNRVKPLFAPEDSTDGEAVAGGPVTPKPRFSSEQLLPRERPGAVDVFDRGASEVLPALQPEVRVENSFTVPEPMTLVTSERVETQTREFRRESFVESADRSLRDQAEGRNRFGGAQGNPITQTPQPAAFVAQTVDNKSLQLIAERSKQTVEKSEEIVKGVAGVVNRLDKPIKMVPRMG
ncbi:MAG: hypothetical protein Fues2KO_24170 [Fuerstiella sp.]